MLRPYIACGSLVCVALTARAQQKPEDPGSRPAVQNCRTLVTAATTRSTRAEFSANTTAKCSYDRAANKATCTNKYTDNFGTSRTAVSVTTFGSLDDLIGEVKVVPPLRRWIRADTTLKGTKASTTSLVNTYDRQNRLVQEVGTSAARATYTTIYTNWDRAGRPTAGTSVLKGGRNTLALAYSDANHTQTTTTTSGGQKVVRNQTFDPNGNPTSTSCTGVGGSKNGSTTTTTATERICR